MHRFAKRTKLSSCVSPRYLPLEVGSHAFTAKNMPAALCHNEKRTFNFQLFNVWHCRYTQRNGKMMLSKRSSLVYSKDARKSHWNTIVTHRLCLAFWLAWPFHMLSVFVEVNEHVGKGVNKSIYAKVAYDENGADSCSCHVRNHRDAVGLMLMTLGKVEWPSEKWNNLWKDGMTFVKAI